MIGGLTAGIIVFLAVVAIAIIFLGWIVTSVVLIGLLGWHIPGWIIGPPAHFANTLIASALTLATIMATFIILLKGYNVIPF
jgi:hypothetical protein